MLIFDSHCDTASRILEGSSLWENSVHWSLKRAKEYSGFIQFFAAFMPPEEKDPSGYCLRLLDALDQEIEQYSEYIHKVTCYRNMKKTLEQGKIAAFFTIEGGFGTDIAMVEKLFQKGVRCMGLCWNEDNALCGGAHGGGIGLTALGKEAVNEMNRLGMVVDVSHCSEQSFYDLASCVQKPLIATHSNARAVCSHKRNLTDEQFCVIRDRGGMVGLNLYPPFLSDSGSANMTDFLRHLEHFLSLGGEKSLGLGADFDGIDCCMEGVCGIQDYSALYEFLCRYYKETVVKGIFCENYISFVKNQL